MNLPDGGWVVAPAVMAFGEEGDRVDVCLAQGMLPVFPIEPGADPWDGGRGMEIEMNLTEPQRFLCEHPYRLSCGGARVESLSR